MLSWLKLIMKNLFVNSRTKFHFKFHCEIYFANLLKKLFISAK